MVSLKKNLLAGTAFCFLAGCTFGPDFVRPAAPGSKGFTATPLDATASAGNSTAGAAQKFAYGQDIPAEWWKLFHSEALNALIVQSLQANPTMEAAKAALRQAHEATEVQQAAFFPTLGANFTPQRAKNAVQVSPTLATPTPYFNLFTGQVSVSYVPDVFGVNRRAVESLAAQEESLRFEGEATYLTLTANVVAAAVQEASLRGQIAATQEIIRAESESLALLKRQYGLGAAAGGDVAAQEAALAQARAALPPLQKQLAQQRDLLAALAGRLPDDQPKEQFDLAGLQLPADLPVSLPAKLVEQRPDIRQAEAQMHAAAAEIGVAIGNFLPQLTLSANSGSSATMIGNLFQPGNGFWTVGANLSQTLFDGGALLHKRRAADAALDQAGAQYRSTVITAFQNVADTLHALEADAEALKAETEAERAAADSLTIAKRQVELGAASYLSLLTAEQAYQQAVIARVQAQAARFADTAALFQALGGGWWNRPAEIQSAAAN